MIKKISVKTKLGWISAFENEGRIFKIKFGKVQTQSQSRVLKNFEQNLLKFFRKASPNIKVPYKVEGNQAQRKVWSELKKIKLGTTKTYGEIAKKYKLSPRHVGKICGQNKLLLAIPCHRVIKSDGSLGGFSSRGGVKLKKKLLEFETSWK
jgi:methylated-DNA-[protein]-cysteine S-methyltransferase|tara:strand:- start:143 stop:595 length:453 start_codon:yes stop_codon:yes gene_type:complete